MTEDKPIADEASLFRSAVKLLGGSGEVSRLFDVNTRTMGRMMAGKREIPAGLWKAMCDELHRQAGEMNAFIAQLGAMP